MSAKETKTPSRSKSEAPAPTTAISTKNGQILVQDQLGRVSIQPEVVAKIAGLAIRHP